MHTTVLMIAAIVALWITFKGVRESYKKFTNSNFRGGDITSEQVSTRKQCFDLCNDTNACKAVTMTKNKKGGTFSCWLKNDEAVRGGNRTNDSSKNTWIKDVHYDYWKDNLKSSSYDESGKGCNGKVTLYQDANYGGDSREFGCGTTEIEGDGFSSMKIPVQLKVRLYGPTFVGDDIWSPEEQRYLTDEEKKAELKSDWITGDLHTFGNVKVTGFKYPTTNWNDKVTKIQVAARQNKNL